MVQFYTYNRHYSPKKDFHRMSYKTVALTVLTAKARAVGHAKICHAILYKSE
jgi:hypothetical protein